MQTVKISLFRSFHGCTLYELTITDNPVDIKYFEHRPSTDPIERCAINRCIKLENIGFISHDAPSKEELEKRLSTCVPIAIGTEASSTSVKHLFCSGCYRDCNMKTFKMTDRGCVVCENCLSQLGIEGENLTLNANNFIYLDRQVDW